MSALSSSLDDWKYLRELAENFEEHVQSISHPDRVGMLCSLLNTCRTVSTDDETLLGLFRQVTSRVHEKIATIVIEDAEISQEEIRQVQSETRQEFVESGKALLECLGSGKSWVWPAFIDSLEPQRRLEVVKGLLRASYQSFRATDTPRAQQITRGLEVVLKSTHSMDTMALLLSDEVEKSANEAPRFFCTTDMGRLLSLSTLPLLDARTQELTLDETLEEELGLSYLESYENLDNVAQKISEDRRKFTDHMSASFEQLLTSRNEMHTRSALRWACTVLQRNTACSGEVESVCFDGYLLNVCKMLLLCYKSINKEDPQLLPVNSSLITSYFLDIDVEACTSGGSEVSNAEAVIRLCRSAIKMAITPTLHRLHRAVLEKHNSPFGDSSQEVSLDDAILNFYHRALWGSHISEQIARFFKDQLHIMNHLLEATEESPYKALSGKIGFDLLVVADWLAYCSEHHTQMNREVEFNLPGEDFSSASASLLQRDDSIHHLEVAFKLIPALHRLIGCDKTRETLKKKLLTIGLPHLTNILVEAYVHALSLSAVNGNTSFADAHDTRHSITQLLLTLLDDEEAKDAMGEHFKEHVSEEFLVAILDESVYLTLSKMDILRASISNTSLSSSSPRLHLTDGFFLNQERERTNLMYMIHSNLRFLSCLVDYDPSGSKLARAPLSYRVASVVCHLLELFCLPEESENSEIPLDIVALLIDTVIRISRMPLGNADGILAVLGSDPKLKLEYLRNCLTIWSENENFHGSSSESSTLVKHLENFQMQRTGRENADRSWLDTCLQSSYDEDALLSSYASKLEPHRLCSASLVESHCFRAILDRINLEPQKTATLSKELAFLRQKLPTLLNPTIFLVHDKTRVDVMRCALSGPRGTPYSGGLFVFDICCPSQYPKVPPLVHFLTTGFGTADFSPYLRRDGRVCLNLQDCSQGDQAGDDWDPEKGPLYMVLDAIKTLFSNSEPSGAHSPDTSDADNGEEQRKRILEIQDMTLRYAMVELIRNPPPGLDTVVHLHFALQKQALLKQCGTWVEDSTNDSIAMVLRWDVRTLYDELEKLGLATSRITDPNPGTFHEVSSAESHQRL